MWWYFCARVVDVQRCVSTPARRDRLSRGGRGGVGTVRVRLPHDLCSAWLVRRPSREGGGGGTYTSVGLLPNELVLERGARRHADGGGPDGVGSRRERDLGTQQMSARMHSYGDIVLHSQR